MLAEGTGEHVPSTATITMSSGHFADKLFWKYTERAHNYLLSTIPRVYTIQGNLIFHFYTSNFDFGEKLTHFPCALEV